MYISGKINPKKIQKRLAKPFLSEYNGNESESDRFYIPVIYVDDSDKSLL